jgi:POT family proton-dependent oligopeptide transporter
MPAGVRRLILFQFMDTLSFYGSRLLLVLYLVDLLMHPGITAGIWGLPAARESAATWLGLRTDQAFVSAAIGLFGALANLTPVVGGWLSDRFMSRRHAVIAGALLMVTGHVMLALQAPFLIGLLCLACGNGFYRATASAMLANLFDRDDPRMTGAFQLFYSAANLSLLFAPILCGTLGELVGWSWGFGAAGSVMLLGLVVFLSIPSDVLTERHAVLPTAFDPAPSSTEGAIGARLLLLTGVALFMIGNEQLSNSIVIWLEEAVDRHFGAATLPLTWFFAVAPVTVAAGTAALARWRPREAAAGMRRRMVQGCFLGGGAFALLALAATLERVPAMMVILFLILWGSAFALVVPSGAGLIAALTPEAARGRWSGIYLLMTMVANLVVGAIGGLYGRLSHPAFILLHAGIVFAATGPLTAIARRDRANA